MNIYAYVTKDSFDKSAELFQAYVNFQGVKMVNLKRYLKNFQHFKKQKARNH